MNYGLRVSTKGWPVHIEQFMAGKQPRRLTLMWFQRNRLMVDWHAQRQLMATFEEDA